MMVPGTTLFAPFDGLTFSHVPNSNESRGVFKMSGTSAGRPDAQRSVCAGHNTNRRYITFLHAARSLGVPYQLATLHFVTIVQPCAPINSCGDPCRAVPCRAVPCRAVPCRAVPCRAVPCRAVVTHRSASRVKCQISQNEHKNKKMIIIFSCIHVFTHTHTHTHSSLPA
jgi:hypothetical protein